MIARKEEEPESAGVTCIVDGSDNRGVGEKKRAEG